MNIPLIKQHFTWNTTASATFDLCGLQLEVGEKATPFEHRSYGDELAKCYRYYELWPAVTSFINHQQLDTTTSTVLG